MKAYYNEHDPKAAAWLRELIARNLIAPGEVDERSIEDVTPNELRRFTQCHFFAGIGVWSYALRKAGWPDDRPVWTGSCPCQPFSAAGKGGGFADERHLWPAFHWLIEQSRPPVVFGEQVASKNGLAWLDLVQADLEGSGYASRAVDLCAAGFGAPHIRQRLYWVADSNDSGPQGREREELSERSCQRTSGAGMPCGRLAHSTASGHQRGRAGETGDGGNAARIESERLLDAGGMADAKHPERREIVLDGKDGFNGQDEGRTQAHGEPRTCGEVCERSGPVNGFWGAADWLLCRDGKWRAVEPGTFPLAHGSPARVGRLRGYGNALNAEVAAGFVRAYMETR